MLNFLGLFGADSPLPHYFTSWLSGETEQAERARKFLIPFNHRIYQLLYSAWIQYKVPIRTEQDDDNYLHVMRHLG